MRSNNARGIIRREPAANLRGGMASGKIVREPSVNPKAVAADTMEE